MAFPGYRTWGVVALAALVLLVLPAVGCAGGASTVYVAADGGPAGTCAADQHLDSTGVCVAGPPPECAPGSMKALGETECAPIGWTECGEGFEKDPSGWGCHEIVGDACSGATRAALGSATCVPVGDCNAAFPPPNATLFVSATGATDATHFRLLENAVLASRAGDVIAVDAGVYHESAQFDHALTVVGRCAAKVIFDGTGLTTPGLIVDAPIVVRGITLRKFPTAIQLSRGIDLQDSVLDGNDGQGIYSEGAAITAKISRSVIRNTAATTAPTAFGIDIAGGTTMDVVDTEISNSQGAGIIVTPGSTVKIASSVVRGNTKDSQGKGGYGINGQGGNATITGSAFIGNADTAIRAYKGATFVVERTVVRGTKPGDIGRGYGLVASAGGTLTASKVVVTETQGVGIVCEGATARVTDTIVRAQKPAADGDFGDGIYVFNAGTLTLTRVAVLDNVRSGVDVFDPKTEATLDHVLLTGTKSLPKGDMGLGVAIGFGAHAKIDATVIASNHQLGIYSFSDATFDLTKSAIRDTSIELTNAPLGHGILVADSKHVVISGCEIRRSAGIGVAFANASGVISKTVIADNAVGIHVQDGSSLMQVDAAPLDQSVDSVAVTADTTFEGNATRQGSGVVALPNPLPKM